MSFPKYPKYKASGVEWLGDVPEGWEVVPLFGVAVERKESNFGMVVSNLLSLSYGRIVRKDITSNDGLLPESFETYQIVRPGDIVLRLTDLQNDKRSLRSALVEETGIITSAYVAIAPRTLAPRFLSYLLRAYDATKVFYSMGGGLRQAMKFADVKRLPTLLPSQAEQLAIAAFLDCETAKIDELVNAQARLIELLKEKRQAVISHAVTKGLNPHAPMKPAGIEWLGDVPEHWEVCDLNHALCAIGDVDHFMPESVERGVPYLMTGDLTEFASGIDFERCKQVSRNDYLKLSNRIKSSKGDVVMARYATIGTASYIDVDREFLVSYSCVTIKPKPSKVLGLYIFNYFKSVAFFQGIQQQVNTNTQGNVGVNDLKKIKVMLPNLTEQAEIIEYLALETAKIDTLTAEAQRAITLLRERRSALISAAVTGQIDIRNTIPMEAA